MPKATGESSEMKVLRRLVQPRMDGTYLVPNEIVEKFKDIAGGGRAEVLQLFRKHNGDKDMYVGLQNLYGMSSYGVHYS